jgi:nucleotide-binding universal stress UspA family protein
VCILLNMCLAAAAISDVVFCVHAIFDGNMPMKILVPVDGSPASLRAVKVAIELMDGRQQAKIVLLNVNSIPMLGLLERGSAMLAEWLKEEEDRLAQQALEGAITMCQAAGISFTARIEKGTPAATIERIVYEEKIDHIIMGRRGLGGIRGLVLGSVSTQVLQLAIDVPVTLVK